MTEAPPNIPHSFLRGTLFFTAGTLLTAGSYTLLAGTRNPLRYVFLTTLNVGVAGGLFTGIPP